MSQKDWFILKTESQLRRLDKLLKEYPFIEMNGESVYMRYGYRNLTLGDKETYSTLKDLTLFSKYKYGSDRITPSLDYLASCLGTTIRTQMERINNLEKAELLVKTRRKYKTNIYLVNTQPLPDSTFVSTLIVLIRRKKILSLIDNYSKTGDSSERSTIVNELSDLNENFFYKDIIKQIPKVNNILKAHHESYH